MKRRKRMILIVFIVLAVIGAVFIVNYTRRTFRVSGFNKNTKINYNEKYDHQNQKVCFGDFWDCKELKPKITGEVDTNKIGTYEVKYVYEYGDKKYTLREKIEVVDEKEPEIKVEKVSVCPNGKINELKYSVIDNFDGDITDKAKVSYKDGKVIIEAPDSNNNKAVKEMEVELKDDTAPEITINGEKELYILLNSNYNDEGASATDICDGEVKVDVKNEVDTSMTGEYLVRYTAKDSSGNTIEEDRHVYVYDNSRDTSSGERIVYLTFDDGPSENTRRLLDVLDKYGIKATFFVTGNGPDDVIQREYNEGHTVAIHTNSHVYSYLYASVDNYFDDLNAAKNRIKNLTGYDSDMIRFPGGSSNMISENYDNGIHIMSILTDEVGKRGYHYYDWNVDSDDAGSATTSDEVYNNVISSLKDDYSIVLQHDIKGFSVDAVERIIQYGLSNGYTFRKLSPTSPKAHHRVFN